MKYFNRDEFKIKSSLQKGTRDSYPFVWIHIAFDLSKMKTLPFFIHMDEIRIMTFSIYTCEISSMREYTILHKTRNTI